MHLDIIPLGYIEIVQREFVSKKIKMNEVSSCYAYFMFKILEEYEVVQRESKKKKTFNKKLNLTYRIAYITRKAVKIAV